MITVQEIMGYEPCEEYSEEEVRKLWASRESLNPREVAELKIPEKDRVWALCHCLAHRDINALVAFAEGCTARAHWEEWAWEAAYWAHWEAAARADAAFEAATWARAAARTADAAARADAARADAAARAAWSEADAAWAHWEAWSAAAADAAAAAKAAEANERQLQLEELVTALEKLQ